MLSLAWRHESFGHTSRCRGSVATSKCLQGLLRVRMLPDNVVGERTKYRGIRVDGTYQGKFRCCSRWYSSGVCRWCGTTTKFGHWKNGWESNARAATVFSFELTGVQCGSWFVFILCGLSGCLIVLSSVRWQVDLCDREVVAATWCEADWILFLFAMHFTSRNVLRRFRLLVWIWVHIGVCVFRVVIAMFAFCLTLWFQQVFWFCCWFTVSVVCCCVGDSIVSCFWHLSSFLQVVDKKKVFILRTAKTDSSAETTILCHVCD